MSIKKLITFRRREFYGSRLRCLLATNRPRPRVAEFFRHIAGPSVTVAETDTWYPRGFAEPDEARLDDAPDLLDKDEREDLGKWWLAKSGRANTPNWDLACRTQIDGRTAILVEAKAHEGELCNDRCGATNRDNFRQIEQAIFEATAGLNEAMRGFSLSADSHYQLSNRFAFAWKLAQRGIPVVLVYLGFLNAHDMEGRGRILLKTDHQWQECVKERTKRMVPQAVWGQTLQIGKTPLTVLIRSADVRVEALVGTNGKT